MNVEKLSDDARNLTPIEV